MNNLITKLDIIENQTFFWFSYFSWCRGFDKVKELNIDDALFEVIQIDEVEFYKWQQDFFIKKYIGVKLSDNLSFYIEFKDDEITYYVNDFYIGNLGGHFEAWSLTLNEIISLEKYEFVFLLLLPMVGVTPNELDDSIRIISAKLKEIPDFKEHSHYIAECIANGLVMNGEFYKNDIGTINNQNHSVRNLKKYPNYKANVINLNKILSN